MTAKFPEPKVQYATRLAIPIRLGSVAKNNGSLISQVTKDAYQFIFSRCGKDLQIALIVALGLNALFEEYEKGEFTKAEDFDQEALARENYDAQHPGLIKRMKRANEIAERLGREPIQKLAEGIYNEQRALEPTNRDGFPFPDFWDEKVTDDTRSQYIWAAAIALNAQADANDS